MPLNEKQKEILKLVELLDKSDIPQLLWYIELKADNHEMDQEAIEYRKSGKTEVFLEQGRIEAKYYAMVRLSNAALSHKRAMEEISLIHEHWEEMEKDSPIYWEDGKLVGDIVAPDETV